MRAVSLSRQVRPWAAAALAAPRLAVTAAAPLARPASVRIPVACFASSAAPAHPDPAAGSPAPTGIVETFKAEWALMKDLGFWGKLKFLGKKYGMLSFGVYGVLYFGPWAGLYPVYLAFDNFGLDPLVPLDAVGMRDSVLHMLGLEAGQSLEKRHVALLLSYVSTEVLELVRLPATILLLPTIHKAIQRTPRA